MEPRYPHIAVQLIGCDGNAFAILGSVTNAMCRAGVPEHEIDASRTDATSADYDHLLETTMRWLNVT
jgi:hypothetical protein